MERDVSISEKLPRKFFQERVQRWLIGATAVFWLLSFVSIWYGIGRRDAAIVLHYNVYFGIDILGSWWQAYYIPCVGLGMWVAHIILSLRFFLVKEYHLSRVSLYSLFFLETMILVASVAIALVNY